MEDTEKKNHSDSRLDVRIAEHKTEAKAQSGQNREGESGGGLGQGQEAQNMGLWGSGQDKPVKSY